MARTRISAALLLCLAGGALSLILLSKHYGVPLLGEAALAACGEDGGCDIVSQSRYAVFLGLPLAAWGLLFYGSLFALLAPALSGRTEETPEPSPSLAFFLVALIIDNSTARLTRTRMVKFTLSFGMTLTVANILIVFLADKGVFTWL